MTIKQLMILALSSCCAVTASAQSARSVLPDAILDLQTSKGLAQSQAQWRYSDTQIQAIDHRDVGADLRASGAANRTFDFTPDARGANFDDTKWTVISPESLEARRGHGRLSFNWY